MKAFDPSVSQLSFSHTHTLSILYTPACTFQVKVPIVVDSLEWTLSSPPPLHQFDEPPIIVEFPEEDH